MRRNLTNGFQPVSLRGGVSASVDAEEPERPDAGLIGEITERVRTEMAAVRGPYEIDEGSERRQEDGRLEYEPDGTIRRPQLVACPRHLYSALPAGHPGRLRFSSLQ